LSYDDSLDKDRLYFTQCNDSFPNRCLECTSTKILRHCKIYHNFPAIWRHLKQDHNDILESRMNEIILVLNDVFKAYKWNMFPKWEYSEAKIRPTTTSSSILFDGKPPRIDVLERLRELARLFKGQSEWYPNFKEKQVFGLIKVILGLADQRTKKKYFECVRKYSTPDKIKGQYDVTQFCKELGA